MTIKGDFDSDLRAIGTHLKTTGCAEQTHNSWHSQTLIHQEAAVSPRSGREVMRCRCEGVQPGRGASAASPEQRDSPLLPLVYSSLPVPPALSDPCHVIFVTLSPCEKYPVGGQARIEKQGAAPHFVKYQVGKQPLEALQWGRNSWVFLFVSLFLCFSRGNLFNPLNISMKYFYVHHPFSLLACFWIQFDLRVCGEMSKTRHEWDDFPLHAVSFA